ncbi:MAG TPA: TIGR03564 family F420-dependent LLM class oxidoreductase [Thermomicrobiales bacterium]|nr:TIGR03564 family F420-dependent LLM class oxidoreductase [Thermomicrobiales bacterium]
MRIGVNLGLGGGVSDLEGLLRQIAAAEARGLAGAWTPNIRAFDALTVLALAGPRTGRIELGTYVVPTYPRHPAALAQQALTVQAATGNRLTLGIGLSHRVAMEDGLGYDWSHPIRHMREYLLALDALLSGEPATFAGEEFRVKDYQLTVPGATPPPVLVAALGPQMLRLTGQLAAGTAIWMGGPRYLAHDCVPVIAEAARRAGRPAPRVLVGLPVCVTDRPEEVRRQAATAFELYGQLPSYRAILDKEGAAGPADVALIGPEATVRAGVEALAAAGATDLIASVYAPRGESADRTLDLLAALTA